MQPIFMLTFLAMTLTPIASKEWLAADMRNPEVDWEECNLPEPNGGKSLICDPDKILKRDEVKTVNWFLDSAAHNKTQCPCSNHYCEVNRLKGGYTGYHIGVALVRKMKLTQNEEGKDLSARDQAVAFAHELEKKNWAGGACNNDIVVFFAQDDMELAIHAGATAALRLDGTARQKVMHNSQDFFANGKIIEGLNTMVRDMKILLNCDVADSNLCELTSRSGSSGLSSVLPGLLLATFSLVAMFVF